MRNDLIVAITAVATAVACWVGSDLTAPDCPHEDSCSVDYHDGSWHVIELAPDAH